LSASTNNPDESGCPLDPLVNKTIDVAYRGVRLKFDLSHALFSSFDVDAGTRLLMKEIAHEPGIVGARRLLDAGCGTGIIGISLAASCPAMDVVMRDRDFRAVAFAARNAARNGLPVELYGPGGTRLERCRTRRFSKVKVGERAAPLSAEAGLLCEPDAELFTKQSCPTFLPRRVAGVAGYFEAVRARLVRLAAPLPLCSCAGAAEQARGWCAEVWPHPQATVSTKNHNGRDGTGPEELLRGEPPR
jgi:hypothetical protein